MVADAADDDLIHARMWRKNSAGVSNLVAVKGDMVRYLLVGHRSSLCK